MKPVGKSAAADEHISAGEELAPVSRGRPSAELADFHLRHRVEIGELLRGLEKDEARARGRGYAVGETYACGPCRVCPRGCGEEPDCRQPERRLFALESCGFWVNSLCRRAAEFPLLGGGPEEVRWIRDWGLPEQDSSLIRYVTGIVLG